MSRAGTPIDNAATGVINSWIKEELFLNFNIQDHDDVIKSNEYYIYFFKNKRPKYALNYLTPIQYMQTYLSEPK